MEIQYQYSGWGRADEVHRLHHDAGQRTFTRTSMVEGSSGVETTRATVSGQRVSELMWALSAPPWPRERAVQVVARRVRPAEVLQHASTTDRDATTGCTADAVRGRMQHYLEGPALRAQVDRLYQYGMWTDDYPLMRVVVTYRNAPERVFTSQSQKPLMLPWTLGDFPPRGPENAPASWSAPVSDALRRLLPLDSQAAARLGRDPSPLLASAIGLAARRDCEREAGVGVR